jgi:hypothetical protein
VELQLRMDVNSSSIPDLASLAALQHLQLVNCYTVDASLLASLGQLKYLSICPAQSDKFTDTHLAALLGVLPQLQHLQHLHVGRPQYRDANYPKLRIPLDLCGTVTSTSSLVSLNLGGVQLPPSCGTHLFGQMLPHLKTLNIAALSYCQPEDAEAIGSHNDLDSLVKHCPNLSELNLAGAVRFGVNLGSLQHLQHLTALVVGGACMDDSCAEGLAKLVRLRQLTVSRPRFVVDYGDGDSSDGGASDNRAAGGSGAGEGSSAFGYQLTFRGLRSLMQLTALTKFEIDPYSSVFEAHCRCHNTDCSEFVAPVSVATLNWLLLLYLYSIAHMPCC